MENLRGFRAIKQNLSLQLINIPLIVGNIDWLPLTQPLPLLTSSTI
jgi:hypothetical protein